ncbi:cupredoxin domain-containing protein [Pseudoneobacillus sp. C159]
MSIKKWVSKIVFLGMIMFVTNLGTFDVLAQSQPMETIKSIEVEINDDYFNPKDIIVPNGTTTKLILKNKGMKEHTFTVERLGIDAKIQSGKEVTITVNPKQSGTFELICRYHFQQGMVGKVIVK